MLPNTAHDRADDADYRRRDAGQPNQEQHEPNDLKRRVAAISGGTKGELHEDERHDGNNWPTDRHYDE